MPRGLSARRASISGVALALALVLSLLVGAPAQAANGTLSGTLTGPDGNPYEGFKVEVFQADGDHWQLAASQTVWPSGGLPPGQFAVSLPPGSYRACFSTAFDDPFSEDVGQRCWPGGYDVWGASDLVITDGGTTTIDPALPAEARVVRGRIVGAGGVGVVAYVAPYRRMPNGTWDWRGGEQSVADGTFALRELDPGTYRFCLRDVPRDYFPECWDDVAVLDEAQELTLEPGSVSALHFRLARKAAISGTVTPPPGSTHPMTAVAYRLSLGQWAFAEAAGVAPDGSYRIGALQSGTYRVCVNGYDVVAACWQQGSHPAQATDIVLTATQQRAGIDLAPGPAGFVSGTLPDVYLGAQGYPSVTAWRRVGDTWEGLGGGEAIFTGIDNNWTYEIGSLPTGTYVVCVEHSEPEFVTAFPRTCNGGSPSPQGAVPFEVVAGATTSGIDIATGQAGEIRGGVLGAAQVRVDLYAPTGRLALSQVTGPDGRYEFGELPPGDYKVGFHRATARSSLAAEWWNNRGDGLGLAGATPVTVADGDVVAGIRATLDAGGAIDGRLLDSAGSPVDGCVVRARARDGSLAVRTAITDAAGDFSIGGLSTASYVVVVAQACSGTPTGIFYDADSPDGTTGRLRAADDVAVTRGATTNLAVALHTSG